ncbi:MAG: YggS family pyridoxal phosphate-dependent enzyme [Thermodesulfobacteriota bacterium]
MAVSVADNLIEVRKRLKRAARKAGRDLSEITLIAVTKNVEPRRIKEAVKEGLRVFGENYIQEAQEKIKKIGNKKKKWHFIGHLQKNKARFAVELFDCIHSIDTPALAREINRRTTRPIDVLIQVNITGEKSKYGVSPDEAIEIARIMPGLKNLNLRGLMAIPPAVESPARSRPYFVTIRRLAERINRERIPGVTVHDLSMGMSSDFDIAIEEGATMVRVGTAIFGARESLDKESMKKTPKKTKKTTKAAAEKKSAPTVKAVAAKTTAKTKKAAPPKALSSKKKKAAKKAAAPVKEKPAARKKKTIKAAEKPILKKKTVSKKSAVKAAKKAAPKAKTTALKTIKTTAVKKPAAKKAAVTKKAAKSAASKKSAAQGTKKKNSAAVKGKALKSVKKPAAEKTKKTKTAKSAPKNKTAPKKTALKTAKKTATAKTKAVKTTSKKTTAAKKPAKTAKPAARKKAAPKKPKKTMASRKKAK